MMCKEENSMSPIDYLMQAIRRKYGNKVYMRDLEKLLKEKLADLDPKDAETIMHLVRDINNG
jgi:hypothetical protein